MNNLVKFFLIPTMDLIRTSERTLGSFTSVFAYMHLNTVLCYSNVEPPINEYLLAFLIALACILMSICAACLGALCGIRREMGSLHRAFGHPRTSSLPHYNPANTPLPLASHGQVVSPPSPSYSQEIAPQTARDGENGTPPPSYNVAISLPPEIPPPPYPGRH